MNRRERRDKLVLHKKRKMQHSLKEDKPLFTQCKDGLCSSSPIVKTMEIYSSPYCKY